MRWGTVRLLSCLKLIYRVDATIDRPSPLPRGYNRATLFDLDAAMRSNSTAWSRSDACAARTSFSGASNDVSTWIPKHTAWWKCLWYHVVVEIGHGPSLSFLSLSLSLSLSHALSCPLFSHGSLACSPPTPSHQIHAAATRAAPMILPRLLLLFLARIYSRIQNTRINCNGWFRS